MHLRSLPAFLVLLLTTILSAQTVTTSPQPPVAGQPFDLIVSGIDGGTCGPRFVSMMLNDRTIHLTFGIPGGGCIPGGPSTATIRMPPLDAGSYAIKARVSPGLTPLFTTTLDVSGTPSGITSISPSFDLGAGNRVVVIRGSFPCAGGNCAAPEVLFGIYPARAVERISDTEIHAVVPLQSNNRFVNVTVRGPGYNYVRPSGFTYVSESEYERMIVPVHYREPQPGAFGSLWTSELRLVNLANAALDPDVDILYLEPRCEGCDAPIVEKKMVEPIFARPLIDAQGSPGVSIYVRAGADLVHFQLRVRDLSRQAESWGTEIPVVRERDLTSRATLVDVPVRPEFRQLLRIYLPGWVGCCRTEVIFYSADGEVLATRTVEGTRPPGADGGLVPPPYLREGSLELPLQPGYAELNLRDVPELAGHESIWLTVDSTSANRVWAFVSITNDVTQEITVVTPR